MNLPDRFRSIFNKVKNYGQDFLLPHASKQFRIIRKEVVQVYLNGELKAFSKTKELKPGQSEIVTMRVPVRLLASFDEPNSQWLLPEGKYTFAFASSSRDIRLTADVKLSEYTESVLPVLTRK